MAGDFAGGGVISPGFNGVAGLGIEGCCDGATGGDGGAGCLSLQPANGIVKPKRVTADSNTIFFVVIHLPCNQTLGTPDLEFNTRPRSFVLTESDDQFPHDSREVFGKFAQFFLPTLNFFLRRVEWFTDRAQRILFDSQLLLCRGGWNEGWHVILVDLDNNFWAGANVKSGGDKELQERRTKILPEKLSFEYNLSFPTKRKIRNIMDRLFDEEINVIWAEYYRRRARKDSRILLSALVNIIKGQCLIRADRGGGNYSNLFQSTLHQYEIPTDQFWEIEESTSVK